MTDATTHPERVAKAKLTPEQEAKKDAREIHNSLQHDSASTAYDLMLKEISAARSDFQPGSKDFVAYRNTLTKELKGSNDFVELAPIWGQKAFNKLAVTNSTGQRSDAITQRELSPYVNGAIPTDSLTKSFASALRDQVNDNAVTYEQLGKLAKDSDVKRHQSINDGQDTRNAEKNARLLDSRTKTGKTLFELADVAGALGNSRNVDGKVMRQDIDSLIKLGESGLTPLREPELSFLRNLSANWDKPEVKKLRNSNGNGLELPGSAITAESLAAAKHPGGVKDGVEGAASDNQERLAIKKNVELLRKHTTATGKSLLEAADYIGGNGHADELVNKQDIDALLQASRQHLVKISEADQRALQAISEGWDKDPEVLALRQTKSKGTIGDPVGVTGLYITPLSLKQANGDLDREAQTINAAQSMRLDEMSVGVRREAAEYVKQLESLKLGKNNLFNAADVYGATRDGIIKEDQVDHKIDLGDLQKLASVLIVSNGAESPEYRLVSKLVKDWDTPAVKAMRAGNAYLTPESMSNIAFF